MLVIKKLGQDTTTNEFLSAKLTLTSDLLNR